MRYNGEQVKANYCSGSMAIKCCPTGKAVAKPVFTPAPGKTTPKTSAPDSCLYNQPGSCINTDTHTCRGAQVRAGFCRGAGNIKCCPSGQKDAKPPSTPPPPSSGDKDCLYSNPGTCIDTNMFDCKGKKQ